MQGQDLMLDLADSEVAAISSTGADLVLVFSAAAVQRADGVHGFLAAVSMTFRSAGCTGNLARCIGKLSDGSLTGVDVPRGLLPLPFATSNTVHAQLQFANGAALDVHAAGMECRITGEERFTESYAC